MASEFMKAFARNMAHLQVLILVLVEDGFRAKDLEANGAPNPGLNPCSCGRWLQRPETPAENSHLKCLNPCSCGRWLQRAKNAK